MEHPLKNLVLEFFKTIQPNVRLYLLKIEFEKKYNVKISRSWFNELAKEFTHIKTVNTGAAEVKLSDVADLIVCRTLNRICVSNVWALDEKIFNPKQFVVKSVRVYKGYKGQVYKTLYSYLKTNPIYLLCCCAFDGIVGWIIQDTPIIAIRFNSFVVNLAKLNNRSDRWLLFDNASIHEIDPTIHEILKEYHCNISYTAPCSCFTNPIEEVFSVIASNFLSKFHDILLKEGFNGVARQKVIDLIVDSIKEVQERDFTHLFIRAGLSLF